MQRAIKVFSELYTLIQIKVLYRTAYEISYLQDKPIAYGWKDAKVAKISGQSWFFYYIGAFICPKPLDQQERSNVFYGRTIITGKLKRGQPLRQRLVEIPSLQLKKRSAAALEEEIRASLWRIEVAGNIWGERRRFAREDAATARNAVIDLQNLTEIEKVEFDRRLKGATEGAFGNWKVPAT